MEIDAPMLPDDHELIHAYTYARAPRRPTPFLAEGFAEAIGCRFEPPIPTSLGGDWRSAVAAVQSEEVYGMGGLFVRQMIRRHGIDEFPPLLRAVTRSGVIRRCSRRTSRASGASRSTASGRRSTPCRWEFRSWTGRSVRARCRRSRPGTGITADPARTPYWTLPDAGDATHRPHRGPLSADASCRSAPATPTICGGRPSSHASAPAQVVRDAERGGRRCQPVRRRQLRRRRALPAVAGRPGGRPVRLGQHPGRGGGDGLPRDRCPVSARQPGAGARAICDSCAFDEGSCATTGERRRRYRSPARFTRACSSTRAPPRCRRRSSTRRSWNSLGDGTRGGRRARVRHRRVAVPAPRRRAPTTAGGSTRGASCASPPASPICARAGPVGRHRRRGPHRLGTGAGRGGRKVRSPAAGAGGKLQLAGIINRDETTLGVTYPLDDTLHFVDTLSALVDFYPNPLRGLHFGGSLGLAAITELDTHMGGTQTSFGFAAALHVGTRCSCRGAGRRAEWRGSGSTAMAATRRRPTRRRTGCSPACCWRRRSTSRSLRASARAGSARRQLPVRRAIERARLIETRRETAACSATAPESADAARVRLPVGIAATRRGGAQQAEQQPGPRPEQRTHQYFTQISSFAASAVSAVTPGVEPISSAVVGFAL